MTRDRGDQTTAAVAALAADVEDLGRKVHGVAQTAAQAAEDAGAARRAVVDVANLVSGRLAGSEGGERAAPDESVPPWLLGDNAEQARADLADLVGWLRSVYLHYHQAELGECWLWHPGVVAELTALRNAWAAAHFGDGASPARVMDWHDGYRPRVVQRLAKELADCHLDRHVAGGDREYRPVRVPGVEMSADIARWWASSHGSTAAPAPSLAVMAEARAARSARPDW
ncbi:hypothetical protein ACFW0V_30910 [Micromonospora parva]|uniref:hypothetical protein n=1 Tax=Micromonospora parva TaxID=1464048 RepID=UPI00366C468C